MSGTASFSQLPLATQKGRFVFIYECKIGAKLEKTGEEYLAKAV